MPAARAPGTILRIATLNLWRTRGDWAARRHLLRAGLQEVDADVVAVQEAILADAYDEVVDLLEPEYSVVQQRDRAADGGGIAIASRWPVARVDEVDLHVTSRTAGFECGALLAEVRVPGPIGLVVIVNHFPSWQPDFELERERQAVVTARAIEAFRAGPDQHVIVAGDMDADPDAASIRFWMGRQSLDGLSVCYRDAWASANPDQPGETFTPANPLVFDPDWPYRRIDYVLVRCGPHSGPSLGIRGCERFFDEPVDGVGASDHFGVIADLALPEPRQR